MLIMSLKFVTKINPEVELNIKFKKINKIAIVLIFEILLFEILCF